VANVRISDLPSGTLPLSGDEITVAVQDGVTVQIPINLFGLTPSELEAIKEANNPEGDNPFATMSIFDGLTKIAVVDELPVSQVTGTLYFVKP
jgi:hypothetical protein